MSEALPRWILVSSHQRSGTHFLIDSLVLNCPDLRFPGSWRLPRDFSLGSLLRNDQGVTATFARLLAGPGRIAIKSHLRMAEIAAALRSARLSPEAAQLLGRVQREAFKIYVWRDPRDVLVSRYHQLGYAGSFSAFLRAANTNMSRHGDVVDAEALSNVDYLVAHVREGLSPGVHDMVVRYEDLDRSHDAAVRAIAARLGAPVPDTTPVRRPRRRSGLGYRARRFLWRQGLLGRIEFSAADGAGRRTGHWRDYFSAEDLERLTRAYPLEGRADR